MSASTPHDGETLFWALAETLLADQSVTRGTMMGYPCLRAHGAFFACVERGTGNLIVKLHAGRVAELVACGRAVPFAPAGRAFREWAAFTVPAKNEWAELLREARGLASADGLRGHHRRT